MLDEAMSLSFLRLRPLLELLLAAIARLPRCAPSKLPRKPPQWVGTPNFRRRRTVQSRGRLQTALLLESMPLLGSRLRRCCLAVEAKAAAHTPLVAVMTVVAATATRLIH
jgi:hypothetical protein